MHQYAAIDPAAAGLVLKEAASDPVERAVLELLLRAGLRGSEVRALTRIHFTPAVARPRLRVGTKFQPRTICVAPQVADAISALLRAAEVDLGAPIVPLSDHALVRLVRGVCEAAGVDAGVHHLRRTAIQTVLDAEVAGMDVEAYFGFSLGTAPRVVRPGRDAVVARVLAGAYG